MLKEKNGILLAHYYQRDEVQEIADFTGDSLALSFEAAKTKADVIVFAGVHFMAESASILSPEKTVLLPRFEAGCALADTITVEALEAEKKKYPDAAVVTYINSSAAIKAASDICCTSANAVRVVQSLSEKRVLMIPDGNLARYTAKFTDKEIIPWGGTCPVHQNLSPDDVLAAKARHPGAKFAAHPECREVGAGAGRLTWGAPPGSSRTRERWRAASSSSAPRWASSISSGRDTPERPSSRPRKR